MVSQGCFVYEPLSTDAALELGLLMNQLVPFDLTPRPIPLPTEFAIIRCITGVFQILVDLEVTSSLHCQGANITLEFHALMLRLKTDREYGWVIRSAP